MTNAEKYKTSTERITAFDNWCYLNNRVPNQILSFQWLDMEYEGKVLPCPFCGAECTIEEVLNCVFIRCHDYHCDYSSALKETRHEAIAEHNRIVRAVRNYYKD